MCPLKARGTPYAHWLVTEVKQWYSHWIVKDRSWYSRGTAAMLQPWFSHVTVTGQQRHNHSTATVQPQHNHNTATTSHSITQYSRGTAIVQPWHRAAGWIAGGMYCTPMSGVPFCIWTVHREIQGNYCTYLIFLELIWHAICLLYCLQM
jgi:hypothetical protein